MFTITPIGSCRITTPLKRGQDRFGFALNMARCYGYCHSPAEAVQMAKFMQGQIEIPKDVWPLVSRNQSTASNGGASHEKSNLYVVEIASSKEVTIDGVSVQLNYLNAEFGDFFSDRRRAQAFWELVEMGTQDDTAGFLKKHWSDTQSQVEDWRLLSKLKMRRVTQESLLSDLKMLNYLLGNVLVVSHIDACKPDGKTISSRSSFIKDVAQVSQSAQLDFYNPTPLMDVFGQTNAIEGESTSLAHFTQDFGDAVMQDWMRRTIEPLTDKIVATDEKAAREILVPQVFAAFENGQYADANLRVQKVQHASTELKRLSVELGEIQTSVEDKFEGVAHSKLAAGLTQDDAMILMAQAAGLAKFDSALKLAEQSPSGPQAIPRYTAFQLAERAFEAEQFEAAAGFLKPFLSKNDAWAARLFADVCIRCDQDVALQLSKGRLTAILEHLDMGIRLALVDHLGVSAEKLISSTVSAVDVARIVQHVYAATGSKAAANVIKVWRLLQNKDRVPDKGLLHLLDGWVADAQADDDITQRIDVLSTLLDAAPTHKLARIAMQEARKELTLVVRHHGAAGDLEALEVLAPTVSKLSAALSEYDLWIARLRFSNGDYDAAIQAGERAALNLPEKINNWVLLMRAADRLGEMNTAMSYAKTVVQLATPANAKLRAEGQDVLDRNCAGA